MCLFLFLLVTSTYADELVRQVQEELRKRNLYFGDVDGQNSADLANSLKRYQIRKGFAASGRIDQETSVSLNVDSSAMPERWPDIPILKSDAAPRLPETKRIALEKQAETNLDAIASPAPPAEQPPPSQNIKPEQITRLVEQYLQEGETDDINAQIRYFDYPVTYFDHGTVTADFVRKDVTNYVKRWPERKYTLTEPVSFRASEKEGETQVEFQIQFSVRNRKYSVTGHTKNFWTVRPEGAELKILSIREQRLRE